MNNWRQQYASKLISAEEAAAKVKNGDRIYLGSMCCEPTSIIQALANSYLEDVEMVQFIRGTEALALSGKGHDRFRLRTFHLGGLTGLADTYSEANYVPLFHSQIPSFLRTRRIPIDVAIVQVSEPDANGFFSLGISVDVARSAVLSARTVIAQVNPLMPQTQGDTLIPVDTITYLVDGPQPLYEIPGERLGQEELAITRYCCELIEDGSVLHFGFAATSRMLIDHLKDRRHLGVHTEIFTDPLCDLIESGVIDNSTKRMYTGKSLASCCMGTEKAYRFIKENKLVEFYPSDVLLYPMFIGSNEKMVAVNLAVQVDLRGQIRPGMPAWTAFEGSGGDNDFMIGAGLSQGGRSIICLRSTTPQSGRSTIVPAFGRKAPVIMNRGEVHYVVTEYGAAYLGGKSIRERAMALIEVAHPDHREGLMKDARDMGYVYSSQHYFCTAPHALRERIRTNREFKGGLKAHVRVIRPTDESLIRDLFYDLSESSVYFRYFSPRRAMPHANIREYVSLSWQRGLSIVVTVGPRENRRMIAEGRYVIEPDGEFADSAFMVAEEYHGYGIGTYLLNLLIEVAKEQGLKGLHADVLLSNGPMLKVFERQPYVLRKSFGEGATNLELRFDETKEQVA
jgi:acyl-CoA hydrolase/GNAT superfamily N-acetyltransferase